MNESRKYFHFSVGCELCDKYNMLNFMGQERKRGWVRREHVQSIL
jgi:hypothetical protein